MKCTAHRLLPIIVALTLLVAVPGQAKAAPGDVDPSFSGDGFALGALGDGAKLRHARAVALATAGDGKLVAAIVVVAHRPDCEQCFAEVEPGVARFSPDGSLDPSFAGDGELLLDELPRAEDWTNLELNDIAVQPDGRIVLVGSGDNASAIWVARLNPNGAPDASFGGDGAVLHDFLGTTASATDELSSVALAPDGRIVVGGTSTTEGFQHRVFTVARLLADGSLDPSFSEDGWLTESDPNDAYELIGVAIGADGRIVAVGNPFRRGPDVFAFTSEGTRDPGFSDDGAAMLDLDLSATGMALDPAGRLLLAGEQGNEYVPMLVRLTESGELDGSFGLGGTVAISPPEIVPGAKLRMSRLAVDSQSRPLVASTLGATVVGRFSATGQVDPTFSENGWSAAWARKRLSEVSDIALTPSGVFVAGASRSHVMVAKRGLDDGPTDTDGDGLLNEADECPYAFGGEGCPKIALSISRLKYRRDFRGLGLHGHLRTKDDACKSDRDVKVFRKRPGPDRRIELVRSKRGGIHVYGRFSKGQFYATIKRSIVGYGYCPRARSRMLRLP